MKRFLMAGMAILIVLSYAACSKKEGGEAVQAASRYADQLYVLVSALNSLEYFYDHKEGLRLVGEELGVRTEYAGPADYDMNAVAAAIDQAVAQKAAGIMVVGWEEFLNGAINKAIEAGIPVVTVDADLPTSNRLAFVGTSNYNAGLELGKWMIMKLKNKGNVAMIGRPTLPNVRDRMNGVKAAFASGGVTIVQIGDSKADAVGSAQTAAAILQKFPNLDAMMGIDSHSGPGIGSAIKEAGKVGKVLATGFDRDNSLLELIDEGVVTATVVQRTALMPYYATLILWQLHNSNVALTENDQAAKVRNIPSFVDTGVMIVEQEQAKAFLRKK
jgi:ribose transport system substrate-binding protein